MKSHSLLPPSFTALVHFAVVAAVATVICSAAVAEQVDVQWAISAKSRGGSGPYYWPYSDPSDWLPQVVPNNGNNGNTYRITIGQGLATVDTDAMVDALTVDNSGEISVSDGHSFKSSTTRNDTPPSAINSYELVGISLRASSAPATANLGSLSNYDVATNTLTGGAYAVAGATYYGVPVDATLIFNGARIVTNAAGLRLTGNGKITDEFGNDALQPLAINNGVLVFGQSFRTAGDFKNNGLLVLSPPADQDQFFVITGKLTNFDPVKKTLTGGTYVLNGANSYSYKLRFQFPGADIITNSADVLLSRGTDLQPVMIDEKGQDALRHFANNSAIGSLKLQSDFSTSAAHFTNAGYIVTYSVFSLPPGGTFQQSGGELYVNLFGGGNGFGKLDTKGGSILLDGGRVTGGGRLVGATTSNATISPGDGNYTPLMIFDGSLTLGSSSVLRFDLAATSRGPGAPSFSPSTTPRRLYGYDAIDCTGTVALNGNLKVTLSTATGLRFTPASTDSFTLIKSPAPIIGSFKNVSNGQRLATTDGGGSFVVNYGPNTAVDPNAVVLSQFQANTGPATLLNISTRGQVGSGDRAMIGGFIVTGSEPKPIIVRALGPSLAALGVAETLDDPIMTLHDQNGFTIARNDDWQQASDARDIEATGIPPRDAREAAITATLAPGAYTAVVEGKSGGVGTALVEVYDLDAGAASQLANISTRGYAESGDNALIGGVIVGGGTGSTDVLVRALGPSLAEAGVMSAMPDPSFAIYVQSATGRQTIGSSDNWKENRAAVEATGLAPKDDRESALPISLQPGAYTAVVTPSTLTGSTPPGVGLVEFYRLK